MRGERSIAELVAATPPSRDRYADFLRAASIAVVILGHWLMAVVERRDGAWHAANLLAEVPSLWPATWLLQVMPVFFFVGGFANAMTLGTLEERGAGYATFAAGRAWRLLKPVAVLLAVWLPLTALAQASGRWSDDELRIASTVVAQPLWFIGVYLIVTALAPPMRRLHRRAGVGVAAALALATGGVDLVRFTLHRDVIGYLNFALVWLYAQQLGFLYADGRLRQARPAALLALALAGLAGLGLLTGFGPYPRSMVGLPGDPVSNMNPPTVCLVALTTWQVALLALAREPVARWLERPRPWGVVIAANSVIMTMFLWHLTSLLVVAAVLVPAGFQFAAGSGGWWVSRLPWILLLAGVTWALVAAFGRWERTGPAAPRGTRALDTATAALAMALAVLGTCGFAVSGLVGFAAPAERALLGIPVSPLIDLAALAASAALFRPSRTGVWTGR